MRFITAARQLTRAARRATPPPSLPTTRPRPRPPLAPRLTVGRSRAQETEALVGSVGSLETRLMQEAEAGVGRLNESMQQVMHVCSQLEAKTAQRHDALDAKFTDKTAAARLGPSCAHS